MDFPGNKLSVQTFKFSYEINLTLIPLKGNVYIFFLNKGCSYQQSVTKVYDLHKPLALQT